MAALESASKLQAYMITPAKHKNGATGQKLNY